MRIPQQALLHATDQEAANELLYDGTYLVSYGPLNVVHPCYWEGAEDMYPHDLERARELLDEVGWRDEDGDGIREAHGVPGVEDGTPLGIRWTVLHHEEIGEAVQTQVFASCGCKFRLGDPPALNLTSVKV